MLYNLAKTCKPLSSQKNISWPALWQFSSIILVIAMKIMQLETQWCIWRHMIEHGAQTVPKLLKYIIQGLLRVSEHNQGGWGDL